MMKKSKKVAAIVLAAVFLCACTSKTVDNTESGSEPVSNTGDNTEKVNTETGDSSGASESVEGIKVQLAIPYKDVGNTNPISSNLFFADPTSVEYEGRIYVYGTCDTQQYKFNGGKGDNGYGQISSLSCFSTDDMKNWTYHGDIDVHSVCKWASCSWAPSIVSRTTDAGETEFFLYFCNSGGGIGVMKSNSPLGPWEDPLKHAILPFTNADLRADPVCWCFDPGVVIDDNGVGWLAFGGGTAMHADESGLYTGNCRIVRLGEDMISVDSSVVKIPAPYHFEANELNYINGKYILTYCSNWEERKEWPSIYDPIKMPAQCTMCYMVSDDPLNPDSWKYGGEYLKNATGFGLDFSNNHTHLQKFGDKYYLFYQNVMLLSKMKVAGAGGYRSIGVDELAVDEANWTYSNGRMTTLGVKQLKSLDPFEMVQAETSNVTAAIEYVSEDDKIIASGNKGSWTCVVGVDFGDGASSVNISAKGKGVIEIRLDNRLADPTASFSVDSEGAFATVNAAFNEKISGVHDVFFVFGEDNLSMDNWQAVN